MRKSNKQKKELDPTKILKKCLFPEHYLIRKKFDFMRKSNKKRKLEYKHELTKIRAGHTVTNQNILRFSETPCWETIDSFCNFEAHTKDPLHL